MFQKFKGEDEELPQKVGKYCADLPHKLLTRPSSSARKLCSLKGKGERERGKG